MVMIHQYHKIRNFFLVLLSVGMILSQTVPAHADTESQVEAVETETSVSSDSTVPSAQESVSSESVSDSSAKDQAEEPAPSDVGEGSFKIISAVGNYALDINGGIGSAENSANADIWRSGSRTSEIFTLQKHSDAKGIYYTILAYTSDKALDVSGAADKNGANVQQYSSNQSSAQKFRFYESADEGFYVIKPDCSENRVLDVSGGVAADRRNVQIWSSNGTSSQTFYVRPLGWGSCYSVINTASLRSIDAKYGEKTNGTNVWLYDQNGTAAQIWQITRDSSGFMSIRCMNSGLCLDVSGNGRKNGTNVQIYEGNGTDAQKWSFLPADETPPSECVLQIFSAQDHSQMWDVSGASLDNGTVVQTYKSNHTGCQYWKMQSAGNGYYYIMNLQSGKVLDVSNGQMKTGARVQQWASDTKVPQQKWKFVPTGRYDGSYYIEAYNTGLRLAVSGGSARSGAALTLASASSGTSQIFYLQKSVFPQSFVSRYSFSGSTSQIIDVHRTGKSTGTLTVHNRNGGVWTQVLSVSCALGENGVSWNRRQGDKTTPGGVYTLGQAFGILDDPGSARSYHKVTKYDYWCGDSSSRYYNRLVDSRYVSFNKSSSEHLINYKGYYDYAVAINFNTEQNTKRGSAIFLHCKMRNYTAGCVAIPKQQMIWVLKNLRGDTKIYIH